MRAIKIFFAIALSLTIVPVWSYTLTCSSSHGYTHCPLPYAQDRDIRLEAVERGNCTTDNAWGVDPNDIWVHNCSAVFEYTPATNEYNGDPDLFIAPDFLTPFYGPGFYYGAGYYESYDWNGHNYCSHHNCNNNQQYYYPDQEYHPHRYYSTDNDIHTNHAYYYGRSEHAAYDGVGGFHEDEGVHGGEGFHGHGGGGRR